MPNKRKAELTAPPHSIISAPTASWSREQMARELGKSLPAYDDAYRRGASMPPRYRVGRFWRHLIIGYEQWQREQVAKAEAEAQRKRLASKPKRAQREASTAVEVA
jgi:hypothetical protein